MEHGFGLYTVQAVIFKQTTSKAAMNTFPKIQPFITYNVYFFKLNQLQKK